MEYIRAYRITPIRKPKAKGSSSHVHLSFHDVGEAFISIGNAWYKLSDVPNDILNSACTRHADTDERFLPIPLYTSPPYDKLTRWYLVCQFTIPVKIERKAVRHGTK